MKACRACTTKTGAFLWGTARVRPFPFIYSQPPAKPNAATDSAKRRGRLKKGMSLTETMLVLCLLSILIGLSAFRIQPLWKKYDLRLAAGELKSRLEFIRVKAILESANYEVKISDRTLLRRRKDSGQDWTRHKLKDNIFYTAKRGIKFYASGFAGAGSVTLEIHVNDERHCDKVIVNISGRIRLKKPGEAC